MAEEPAVPQPLTNPVVSAEAIRNDLPDVDTAIDPTEFASGGAVSAEVATLEPPTDIDAATIEDYTSYDAQLGVVTPEATVESRLDGLLSKNSDYMQRATSRADQMSNRRGMLNSSMAVGAAHGAAIDAALPIAQQDAASELQMELVNLGYSNDEARIISEQSVTKNNLETGLEQDTNQFNATLEHDANVANQDATNTANLAKAAEDNRNNFAVLQADISGQLAAIDSELALNLEELTSAYDILQNLDSINGAIYQQLTAEIGTILANSDDKREAAGKINMLIESAGAELSFSTGSVTDGGTTSPSAPGAVTVPALPKRTTPSRNTHSCFTAGTLVSMANGTNLNVEDVKVGDAVMGMDGARNIVMELDHVIVGRRNGKIRSVLSFNGGRPFTTEDHPFMTSAGWKCLDPEHALEETPGLDVSKMEIGDYLQAMGDPLIKLDSIEHHDYDEETPLYNFFLNGNHSYYADGYLVHNKAGDGAGGDGPGGPGGPSGGDGSGCFSGDTCFLMADGEYKPIKEIQIGDATAGGLVTNTRNGPSDRDWYDYLGSKVTDEHFVIEDGVWMYVKNAKQAKLIEPIDTFYTVDTSDHTLHGRNGALFSDDAVFDADDPIHDLPYGKAAWDLMLNKLNSEEWAA